MKTVLLLMIALVAPTLSATPHAILEQLVTRENLAGAVVVYGDYPTEKFYEEEIPWGARAAWGGISNPFEDGQMSLLDFLETFHFLVPDGGVQGVQCQEIYDLGTLMTLAMTSIQKCTVSYGHINLEFIARFYSIGNAVESGEIVTSLPIAVRKR